MAIPADAPRLYCGARVVGELVAFNNAGLVVDSLAEDSVRAFIPT